MEEKILKCSTLKSIFFKKVVHYFILLSKKKSIKKDTIFIEMARRLMQNL
tara:strand:- start:5436 stop:5585 length:150 start_codon:yes stop_codon:yes gene_type:complete